MVSAAHVVGLENLHLLADQAERQMNWWLAARYLSLAESLTFEGDWAGSGDGLSLMELNARTLDLIAKVDVVSQRTAHLRMAVEDLYLLQCGWILTLFDFGYIAAKKAEMVRAAESEAGIRDPVLAGQVHISAQIDKMRTGELAEWKLQCGSFCEMMKAASLSHPDPSVRREALHLMLNFLCAWPDTHTFQHEGFTPGYDFDHFFGPGGEILISAGRNFDYTMHRWLGASLYLDGLHMHPGLCGLLACHYGDMQHVDEQLPRSFAVINRALDEPNQGPEVIGITLGLAVSTKAISTTSWCAGISLRDCL